MWKSQAVAVGAGPREMNRAAGSMAHRKGLVTARVGTYLLVGLLVGVLLAGRVVVLNQMTAMRANIATLQDRKDFLKTQSASLQAKWNEATRAQVICARAERELGLVQPDQPDLVLVKLPDEDQGRGWTLPGWLAGLAGGQPAQASDLELANYSGQMIYLQPRLNDQGVASESSPRTAKP